MLSLYRAYSHIPEFHGREHVTFQWCRGRGHRTELPYAELIRGHRFLTGSEKQYAEGYLDECFVAEDLEQLRAYLERAHATAVKAVEEPLPVRNPWVMPTSWLPCGGGQDALLLSEEEGYDLPFSVSARFDLRFAGADDAAPRQEPAYTRRVGVLWASEGPGVTALMQRNPLFDSTVGALTADAPVRVFIQAGTPAATAARLLAQVERWVAANGLAR